MDQMNQGDGSVSFYSFQDQLAPYGYWLYSDRWGVVWQPADVPQDFRPYYTAGHWAYTDDYGWLWQSGFAWGDIPFHYGRWVNDPDNGWLWMPGYVWSPGWVVWRGNGQYIGWMPMPPDEAFLGGRSDMGPGVSFRFGLGDIGGSYGYSRWYGPEYDEGRFAQNWVFLGIGHIADRDYRGVVVINPGDVVNMLHQTRNVTNYTVVNNYVVNRSIDVHMVERAAGHPVVAVRAASVLRHPNLVTSVDVGQRVQMRMRVVAPRGTGVSNSAPPPPQTIVDKLSAHAPAHGGAPGHLFTKATVSAPEAQSRFHGPRIPAGAAPGTGMGAGGGGGQESPQHPEAQPSANGMTGPNGERPRTEGLPGAGPNGMSGPGEARHHPEAQPGTNGMTGPNGEHPPTEGQPGAGPNGMTGPGEERHHPEAQPGANGMTGPNGEHPRTEEQPAGPNGMTGPGEERHHPEAQPGANGTTGPNGEHRPSEVPPNAGPAAPTGAPRPLAPVAHPHPTARPESQTPPQNPPKKKKEPNPPTPPQ